MNSLQALNLAAPMADTYNRLEEMLLCHIAEQLAANPDTLINATSQWRIKMLAQMGRLTADTAKIIAEMTGKAPEMVESVVAAAVDEVLDEYGLELTDKLSDNISQSLKNYDLQAVKSKYNQVNTVMQYKAKQLFTKSVNGMADRFERIKQKALDNAQEYLDVLNKNAMAVTLGEKSRTEALRETIAEMNSKGIPAFVDASGREWSPEAYINMDIRNTAKNAALAAEFASLDELGQDVILVSSHSGARPKCFPYQGKFYSISGKSGTITDAKGQTYSYSPLKDTSFGEPDGLFGINCGHRMRGVSDGTFINREKEYDKGENDEEYERVQKQRTKERQIRKEKMQADMLEAAGDSEEAKKYRNRAAQHNRELKDYCEENGLSYRKDRTGTYGYVDKSAKSDIINEQASKKFTAVTDEAINRVPNIKIDGYTDEQCKIIQSKHKELLNFARSDNESNEVAFVLDRSLNEIGRYTGTSDSLEFGKPLQGINIFVMHNHPGNSSFSNRDIRFFIQNSSVSVLSIVKNNGQVELIAKTADYDVNKCIIAFQREIKRHIKVGTAAEIDKAVEAFLKKERGFKWIKT